MDERIVGKSAPVDPRAERVLGLLGLARRAGRLAMGATAVEKLVRHGRPPVVIIARDAGENQRRRFASSTMFYQVRQWCGRTPSSSHVG